MDSILTSIKKLLGMAEDYEYFDGDLIIFINTTLAVLLQLGAGPTGGFSIADKTAKWTDFVSTKPLSEFVKTYVELKAKLLFDPPASSVLVEVINKSISELEWRIVEAIESAEV